MEDEANKKVVVFPAMVIILDVLRPAERAPGPPREVTVGVVGV